MEERTKGSGEGRSDTPPGGSAESGTRRLLVVVGEAVESDELREEVTKRLDGSGAEVYVLSPAFARNRLAQISGDVDEGLAAARERLERTLERLRETGLEVSGSLGDSEPDRAIEDALQTFEADEILIVTHPDDEARLLEDEAFERANSYFEQSVTRIVVEGRGDEEHVTSVDEGERGRTDRPEEERGEHSRNFPPVSKRDLGGIIVAIVGTGILIVLAAICGPQAGLEQGAEGNSGLNGCDARALIAGGMALINIAHAVGLLLFQSVRYRGFWEKFFAFLALYGTPLAVLVSLLIE